MRRFLFALIFLFLFSGVFVSAEVSETTVHYFYSNTCGHCANVADSGILDEAKTWEGVSVEKYEVSVNQISRDKYICYYKGFNLSGGSVPFLVVEREGKYSYILGSTPIIEGLESAVSNFSGVVLVPCDDGNQIGLFSILGAALGDAINPCAIGVLLYLMAVLLSFGSSKRAFRYALLYSFVIFVTYFVMGLGLKAVLDKYSILTSPVKFYLGVAILVFSIFEFKDFFWEGKGISLKIPTSAKSVLEKYANKGTFWAMIILGFLVAVVELPCTGYIYAGILSLIDTSSLTGIIYLAIYNFIFVLPLIVIAYGIHKGANVDNINSWVQKNKKWMRLVAGIIMVVLALYLMEILRFKI